MRRLTRLVLLLAPLALLTGCASLKSIVVTANCAVGNHVTISRNDKLTEQTASEIEGNNRSREAGGCKREGAAS